MSRNVTFKNWYFIADLFSVLDQDSTAWIAAVIVYYNGSFDDVGV